MSQARLTLSDRWRDHGPVVWSTGPKGSPIAIAHRMVDDHHGRPMAPVCGRTTEGLWLRAWTRWESVPEPRRCVSCTEQWDHADVIGTTA